MKNAARKSKIKAKTRAVKAVVRYDDALPMFTSIVLELLGRAALNHNCFLRDADGNLTYVIRGGGHKAGAR
jgi:hypothetical protein